MPSRPGFITYSRKPVGTEESDTLENAPKQAITTDEDCGLISQLICGNTFAGNGFDGKGRQFQGRRREREVRCNKKQKPRTFNRLHGHREGEKKRKKQGSVDRKLDARNVALAPGRKPDM